MQQIFTVDQVADHFGKSPRTIRLWITSGKLPARKVGKSYLVTQDAVDELVQPESNSVSEAVRKQTVKEFLQFMSTFNISLADFEASQEEQMRVEDAAWGRGSK